MDSASNRVILIRFLENLFHMHWWQSIILQCFNWRRKDDSNKLTSLSDGLSPGALMSPVSVICLARVQLLTQSPSRQILIYKLLYFTDKAQLCPASNIICHGMMRIALVISEVLQRLILGVDC